MRTESATGLRRGIAILLALEGGEEFGVTRIAELVGREKSQVSRTLKVLADLGLVERDPENLAYRLGWRMFTLAAAAGDRRLTDSAPRCLEELGDDLRGERLSVRPRRRRRADRHVGVSRPGRASSQLGRSPSQPPAPRPGTPS